MLHGIPFTLSPAKLYKYSITRSSNFAVILYEIILEKRKVLKIIITRNHLFKVYLAFLDKCWSDKLRSNFYWISSNHFIWLEVKKKSNKGVLTQDGRKEISIVISKDL